MGIRTGLGIGAVILLAGTMGACVGNIGDDGDGPSLAPPEGSVPEVIARRLTTFEIDNALYALVGDDTRPAYALFPEDVRAPFDNDYTAQQVSAALIEAAEYVATDVASRLVADAARRDQVVGCTPAGAVDDTCLSAFIRRFGRRALRRPLSETEVDELAVLGESFAVETNDFYQGVEVVVSALLQDAEFLYRIEEGLPVPGEPGLYRLDGYEVATRMALLLWGSIPDDALLDLAAAGSLDSPDGVAATAVSMLADPRARPQIDRFHALWLGYDQLPHDPQLTAAMRAETGALLDRVIFDEPQSWLSLFTLTETYVDDALATHYGLPAPGSSTPAWVDVADAGRQGILSQGAFLSVASNLNDTSPTKRGKFIRNRLTCLPGPPLPLDEDVMADAPPDAGLAECKEDQYVQHRVDPACAGCHASMDPIGFGLEMFDREGRFRTHDDANPNCSISGDGELPGLGTFNGPAQLSDILVDSGVIEACAVQHVLQYTFGRELAGVEETQIDQFAERFASAGYRFDELLVQIVSDEAFGFRKEVP